MLVRFTEFIQKHNLWSSDDRLLLAVSGGIDSMVLTHLVHNLGVPFALAHVNYGLRGEASDKDAALVKATATLLGVECFVKHARIEKSTVNIQETARAVRYTFFSELCAEHGFTRIVTAHHADDRIESTLINLMRGTGIYGMKGIPLERDNIVRPMRWAFGEEIEAYAKAHAIPFREDESNKGQDYLRNRIRNELLPLWCAFDDQLKQRMLASAERLEQDALLIEGLALSRILKVGPHMELQLAKNEHVIWSALIYHAFRAKGINRSEATDMAHGQQGARWEKGQYSFIRSTHYLSMIDLSVEEPSAMILDINGSVDWPEAKVSCSAWKDGRPCFDPSNRKAWLGVETADMPFQLRKLNKTDEFKPLGLDYAVNLHKYLLEKGASYTALHTLPVVFTAAGQVCWIPGWAVGEDFKFTDEAKTIVSLSFDPNGD